MTTGELVSGELALPELPARAVPEIVMAISAIVMPRRQPNSQPRQTTDDERGDAHRDDSAPIPDIFTKTNEHAALRRRRNRRRRVTGWVRFGSRLIFEVGRTIHVIDDAPDSYSASCTNLGLACGPKVPWNPQCWFTANT